MRHTVHRVYVENVLEETMKYYSEEEGELTFEQMVPGKYYRSGKDYGICEINQSASNKPADQCPDGPRYKALGNSMAVPCMAWIGKRIDAVERNMK